ncbi:MAG: sulfur carrier protein ThiS [Thermodesulfovibrionales bacterium]|nr:sulfur carrier protein ThiS [Thermodesulfovibrionales bacterium]
MRIKVNGEDRETGQQTVAGLLEEMEVATGRVAVELNMKVLKKADFGHTPLGENDVVEIINFVGGG